MTKEQILENHFGSEFYRLKEEGFDTHVYNAMTEFSEQELTAEREKAAKLVNSLEMALQILEENQKERHPFSIRMIRQSLTEYKGIKPETTGNQTAC